jgi:hypothetical protein
MPSARWLLRRRLTRTYVAYGASMTVIAGILLALSFAVFIHLGALTCSSA